MVVRTNLKITRGELINKLTHEHCQFFLSQPIFVETGSGISTLDLAEAGKKFNAKVYSCDRNQEKINELIARTKGKLDNVEILVGDSLENLAKIVEKHSQIHFAHLDGAASAMHTFREFMTIEPFLKPGACLLIDNAALPEEKEVLTAVRKGKILVPYLLASSHWDVQAHPKSGGGQWFRQLYVKKVLLQNLITNIPNMLMIGTLTLMKSYKLNNQSEPYWG